jgi:hypothetical protein
MKIVKTKCDKCGTMIRNNSIKKHRAACKGDQKLSYFIRKANNLEIKIPMKLEDLNWGEIQKVYDEGKSTAELCKLFSITFTHLSKASKTGIFKNRTRHETMKLRGTYRSILAENDNLRWKRKTYNVIDSYGDSAILESRLEVRFAELCNDCGIKWKKDIQYKLSNNKRYTPDFYLPDFNVHVDPKARFWIKNFSSNQLPKIALFEKEFNTKCIILWDDQMQQWENILLSELKNGRSGGNRTHITRLI